LRHSKRKDLKRKTDHIVFFEYDDAYKHILKALTLEWLEKNFIIEPGDENFMENPKTYAIDKGGFVFMAR